jgi:hypothetical protein
LEGLSYLLEKGFKILSVTIDGRKGIDLVFRNYPTQICQFHIQQRVRNLITDNPKSVAGKELKQINSLFIKNRLSKAELATTLHNYIQRNYDYLTELNEEGKYLHDRLIKALRTFKRNLDKLFTFQNYQLNNQHNNPILTIPNTTNHLDGGVNSKIKELVRTHRGLRKDRRNKLISVLLNSLGKAG